MKLILTEDDGTVLEEYSTDSEIDRDYILWPFVEGVGDGHPSIQKMIRVLKGYQK